MRSDVSGILSEVQAQTETGEAQSLGKQIFAQSGEGEEKDLTGTDETALGSLGGDESRN